MNTDKFTGKASTYAKYRPSYPEEFIDYLYSEIGVKSESTISDIGSGTGIFSKQLLDRGSRVICVEPNENMRLTAESALSAYPNFTSVNGTAEQTTLPEKSVDFTTSAQAFHWFDEAKFQAECRRILKPHGKVILVWNSRVTNSEIVAESGRVCKKLCVNFKGFSGGREESPEALSSFFKGGECDYRIFEKNLTFDLKGFIGRNLSASYAPKESDANYHEFVEELTGLFAKYSCKGVLTLPNLTRSYVGEV